MAATSVALNTAFEELAKAQTTEDIRQVATSVEVPATAATDFVDTLPADDRQAELVELAAAVTAVADLEDLSGEEPDAWDDAQAAIRDLTDTAIHEEALGAAAVVAADNVDALLRKATKAYGKWEKQNRKAIAERDAAVAAATTYRTQMDGYLDEYAELRQQLSEYIDIVQTQGSTVEEGYRQFADASQARRDLRDQMNSLTPPDVAAHEHDRLLSIIDDGISGVEAAERGLDERECDYYGCEVADQPAWQQFRSASQRISAAFSDAVASWRTAAQEAVAEAEAIELPDMPQL